jgi:hypothetical protein
MRHFGIVYVYRVRPSAYWLRRNRRLFDFDPPGFSFALGRTRGAVWTRNPVKAQNRALGLDV